jgi:hypothetical protein
MSFRQLAKKIPGLQPIYHASAHLYRVARKRLIGREGVFTDIYRGNKFGGHESVSGPGSDLYQTRVIIEELPGLCRELQVSSILDIPCGDFHWMDRVDLNGVSYVGADIVKELVQENRSRIRGREIHFLQLNLVSDRLPQVGLILCRDCLVHLSFRDIRKALHNICRSKATYLLTTTFASRRTNRDIPTGEWRPLNLQMPPLCLPEPLRAIREGCTEDDGAYSDKSLGLWRIDQIERSLAMRYTGRRGSENEDSAESTNR